jgi:predicted RNA-binding protein YlxR (DUF448 family)
MLADAPETELDGGPKRQGRVAERTCVATRAVRPVGELIRFVVGPQGEIVPDLKARLPGRGAWVLATREALTAAVRRKAFARAFRREIRVSPDLVAEVEQLLARAALDALAMAGKAGQTVCGFTKVEEALREDHIIGVVHAADAAPDGVRKIGGILRQRCGAAPGSIPIVVAFTSAQLDLALGRPNVIHAALLAGPASASFVARSLRLERFRTGNSGEAGDRDTPPNQ